MVKTVIDQLDNHFEQHQKKVKQLSLRRLFEEDPARADKLSIQTEGLYFDYSKNHITHDTLSLFNTLCEESQLAQAISDLTTGKIVNTTENRPALHTDLRFQGKPSRNTQEQVLATKKQMAAFVDKVTNQQWQGFSGKPIINIVNIGIGGSDLGPRMAVEALSAYHQGLNISFIANIDGADFCDTLSALDPQQTLFIVASKSFTTAETLENAKSARQWLEQHGCTKNDLHQHFVAITSNIEAAKTFDIDAENIFPMWDWVGGRYSLWSAIGLSIALAIGTEHFEELLQGANAMDQHYTSAPFLDNAPVMSALLSYWYNRYWGSAAHAVLPYAQRMNRFPAFLQQLEMESLGKSVSKQGHYINYGTGGIIWGTEGTNGQHSFHQLLHQGTQLVPADFIMVKDPMSALDYQHSYLQACCISQSQALLKGKTFTDAEKELIEQGLDKEQAKQLAPHKVIAGNKPSNTIIIDSLNPKNLGALIAFYEHRVYTLGVLFDINPFDQWGVELGKQLGKPVHQAIISGEVDKQWDSSTQQLVKKLRLNK